MLQVKSFIVTGSTVTRNGVRERDLAINVDGKVNDFLATLDGELVDIKINTEFIGASGDFAFVTVLFKADKPVPKTHKK